MADAADRLRALATALRGPWARLADGRELVVLALPAGDAELAARTLREAAQEAGGLLQTMARDDSS